MQRSNKHTRTSTVDTKVEPPSSPSESACGEQHFSISQIAERWNLSEDAVRRLFCHEPGVLILGRPHRGSKRRYTTLRIPQTVLDHVRLKYTIS
jgi:hypothetical protein